MTNASRLRDSTQIVLPWEAIDGLESRLNEEFVVTIFDESEEYCRIIGSPVEIKEVSEFLARQGVRVQ
ncbi:hypothetical protein ACFQGT_16335 [Natrialbaceae archaeon GCM10025810]|uniref:VNG_1110C family protein n=1 Tax=Halovalidus salilacus TaxID=3075124 RepID=UPI00360F1BB8